MEHPREPKKPLSGRRARSLDRSHGPKKDSESWDCQCLSLPILTTPYRRVLHRTASDGTRCPQGPAQSVEAQGTMAIALSLEEAREFLPSDQRPPQDTKKDKAQRRGQQGWLKTFINFFLRTGPEEPKEKGSRKAKGKEGLPKPAESPGAPGDTAPKKKAHDKKAGRKKHGHKKHVAEETKGAQDQEAEGQETGLPKMAVAPRSEESDLGPAPRAEQTVPGGEGSDVHQALFIEDEGPGASEISSQGTGHLPEEKLKTLDKETIISVIVEFLQRVGDQWEEEHLQAPRPEVVPQNPVPAIRKKSQEKSTLKRAFSHKKHSSEEPKRVGPADVSSPASWPLRRPNFLPLCGGGHQPSASSSPGSEEPQVQEALSADSEAPSSFELAAQAGSQGPEEDLQMNRALEFQEFIQKIITLLQDAEEQWGEKQLQVQEPEVAVENLSPSCRRKSHEKKSSFRKAYSHKKRSPKEPKRAGAAGAASPESRPHKRPSFLPMCMGGHQPSTSSSLDLDDAEFQESSPAEGTPVGSSEAPPKTRGHKPEEGLQPDEVFESKELIIQGLVDLLQEVDDQLGEQIRRHPSFKRFLHKLSDSSLRKLAATLQSRKAHPAEPDRDLTKGPYHFAFGPSNKFAGNNSHAVLSLMGLCSGHGQHSYTHLLCQVAQQNIVSLEIQSPD
ncbi:protein BNIP5 [Mirounga angustirostris]|uniref:protein BNIP5 n=1 Tax=Mirounga angustirostris TaxID=9716 RepID=UPI001E68E4B4|nr:protein BNIP5 [Mirounga angustirostris]